MSLRMALIIVTKTARGINCGQPTPLSNPVL
jgi:hypothetical protein